MKAIKVIFFCLVFLTVGVNAQVKEQPDANASLQNFDLYQPRYQFNVGTSFNYSPFFGAGTTFFASPSVTFPVTKRFSVNGGIIASTTFLPALSRQFPVESGFQARGSNTLSVYGSTIYQLTPNLTLYGAGIKQLTNTNLPFPYNPLPQSSFTFGSSYKIGRNITVGASVNVSQYNNFFSPYNNPFPGTFQAW